MHAIILLVTVLSVALRQPYYPCTFPGIQTLYSRLMVKLNLGSPLIYLGTRECLLSTSKFSVDAYIWFFAAEITLFDGYIVVYKFVHDLHFFVTAGDDENELILASVLNGFSDSVGLLLRLLIFCYYYCMSSCFCMRLF